MDIITSLKLARQNLETIPVSGIANMYKMVGSAGLLDETISLLEKVQKEQSEQPAPENNGEKEADNG